MNFDPIEVIPERAIIWFMAKRKTEDINEAAFRVVRESTLEPSSVPKKKPTKSRKRKAKQITKSR